MVYDCCMFLNENDLFEIRLNQHWNFVDKFIVIEAGETHTGDPKPFNFDHERFKPYSEKLIYVKFDNFQDEIDKYGELLLDYECVKDRGPYMETDDWIRDHFQANYLYKVMLDDGAKDDDIVYISCLDEIIKKSAFEEALTIFADKSYNKNGLRPVISFHCNLFVYKFNILHKHWSEHVAGIVTEFGNFKKVLPTTLRDQNMATHPFIKNGGWHFTFLDDTDGEKVLTKQKSWAHSRDRYFGDNLKYDHMTVYEALERMFRDYPHKIVDPTSETHPSYILENLEKYQKFIYKELITNIDSCSVCGSKNLNKHRATMDRWTLNRFLRLNPHTPKPQGFINHCRDCDYAGFSYRFSLKSEADYYKDYMDGEYLESRAQSEGPGIINFSQWYHGEENVNQCRNNREQIIGRYLDIKSITSVLDFGGDTGLMIPNAFQNCKKYVYEVEEREREIDVEPIKDQKVDLVICTHVLEHVSDINNSMQNIKKFLKPDGYLYVEVPKEFSKHFDGEYNFYEHINLFTETGLTNLLSKHGFETSPVETINYIEPMTTSIGIIGKLIDGDK